MVFRYILGGHFSQVHDHAGVWTAALHEGLKTSYSHFYSEETNMWEEIKNIYIEFIFVSTDEIKLKHACL